MSVRIGERIAGIVCLCLVTLGFIGFSSDIDAEDPGCYLDSYETSCDPVAVFYHKCEITAVFKHYDEYGNPLTLWASVSQKCVAVNYMLPFIKIPCTASDSGSGYGIVTLEADCLIQYGTDYGVCLGASGYPKFNCTD